VTVISKRYCSQLLVEHDGYGDVSDKKAVLAK
jgi:hypothetical protein